MTLLALAVLHVALLVTGVRADMSGADYSSPEYTSVKPSLAVVIGILSIMFALTFLLLVYAKFCHRPARPALPDWTVGQNRTAAIGSSARFSGIDKTVIESLPFFRFSSLQGSRAGLECVVCLSKFEDVEVLRLLPKCRHAFHIDCIDHWLEKHSSCPLCRSRVSSDDLTLIALSNSLRFLNWPPEPGQDSNRDGMELFVQREESGRRGSSRFCSFRKGEAVGNPALGGEEGATLIPINPSESVEERNPASAKQSIDLHKYNHRIIAPDFALRSRWSNVSSSDLITLNSEMLIDAVSARFSPRTEAGPPPGKRTAAGSEEISRIKEEMEMKKAFESKVGPIHAPNNRPASGSNSVSSEQRSVSEIVGFSRFRNAEPEVCWGEGMREERVRRAWLPIARRTVQWFANREPSSHFSQV